MGIPFGKRDRRKEDPVDSTSKGSVGASPGLQRGTPRYRSYHASVSFIASFCGGTCPDSG